MDRGVYVPADLDVPDRILFGLTGRQVAVLAPAAVAVWGLWQSLATSVHPAVLLVASAPVVALALALALARKDGTTLDRLALAVLRHPKRPMAAGEANPDSAASTRALVGRRAGARGPVDAVRTQVAAVAPEGVVDLGAGGCAVAVAAGCVNFDLRAEAEQASLCAAFGRLLHTVEGHLQICLTHRPVDLTGYLDTLAEREADLEDQALRRAAQAHRSWLAGLVAGHELLAREVTVVVTGPDAEAASREAAQVEAFCAQIGAEAHRLDRTELAERIRYAIDPFGTATSAFGSWSS
ncbi:hypothetical protein GCM10029992_36750 [Glycomyces albus]